MPTSGQTKIDRSPLPFLAPFSHFGATHISVLPDSLFFILCERAGQKCKMGSTRALSCLLGIVSCLLLVAVCLLPGRVFAGRCGDDEPGRAEWVVEEGGETLYRSVFTGRHGTLACFELGNPQYRRREPRQLPPGVPEWFSAPGDLNLVDTWDTVFLPFSLTFLELKGASQVTRTVVSPTLKAAADGWKKGETRTVDLIDAFNADPTFTLVQADQDEVVYVWPDPLRDSSDVFIEKRYYRLSGFRIGLLVVLYNFSPNEVSNQPQIAVHRWEPEKPKRGLFSPPPNVMEGLCMAGGSLEKEKGSDLIEATQNPGGEASWVGVGNRYFLSAVVSRGLKNARCSLSAMTNGVVSAVLYRSNPFVLMPAGEGACYPDWYRPDEKLLRCSEVSAGLGISLRDLFDPAVRERAFAKAKDTVPPEVSQVWLKVLKNLSSFSGAVAYPFELYIGPKDISKLKESQVGLEDSLDFWILGFISKPLLYLLRWFYSLVPNWLFAIAMLTILVKVALLYWTQKSFTQMQRMAQLKPLMEELKERYGKDKERLNQEMMNLYKREKVNPLGGCLPMLLQMPIWIALYRTIYCAVELFQAPLGLWIQDLSAPDPYFVLPLLLGASMFLQQKLSPTTMDSAQAKMMLYVMPIMFTVFMLFLPSGLNVYILINTLLSMLQQWYLRKKFSAPKPSTAKA